MSIKNQQYMVGREVYTDRMQEILHIKKSSFVAVTGRRRIGKTYIIDEVYKDHICLRVTGIQNGSQLVQITNFIQKLAEYSSFPIVSIPKNWQEAFMLLKAYLKTLPKGKKQVIFFDELPWISTNRSGFNQILAHLWNDYISKEKHFILVICGSATSWISQKILNDRGGFHNRVSLHLSLKPFTLNETRLFLESKNIQLTESSISELYMTMGGIPYYLDNIQKGESPSQSIARMCFSTTGILRHEYVNLYRSLFDNATLHEAVVKALAKTQSGLTRVDIIKQSKIDAGGPFTRCMEDLLVSGFVIENIPFGKKKQGSIYKLADEYSVFYHKFIEPNKNMHENEWQKVSASQQYKIWQGLAFETLCQKHLPELKAILGISGVKTTQANFRHKGDKSNEDFQIDIVIDRMDQVINLCECKYYGSEYTISNEYANKLLRRKTLFIEETKTKKSVFNTLISNTDVMDNEYKLQAIDSIIYLHDIFKVKPIN